MRMLFAAALVLLAACTTSTAVTLDGSNWRLTDLGGRPVVAGADVTLQFADGHATGFASCNQYRATYSSTGTTLTLGPAISTKRACTEDARNAQETAYLGALSNVGAYTVDGDRLRLTTADGTTLATFTRVR